MNKKVLTVFALSLTMVLFSSCRLKKELSLTYVPEEQGITFEKITDELADNIIRPTVNVNSFGDVNSWYFRNTFDLSRDGKNIAFISSKNNNWNIYVKSAEIRGASLQRTYNTTVNSLAFSPDGENICYTENSADGYSYIKIANAKQGSIVQQISPSYVSDYNPRYSTDGNKLFFQRGDGSSASIWSYDFKTSSFSNHCFGQNPLPINNEEFLCTRPNGNGYYEIWRINYVKGTETILVSQTDRSFTTPSVSPDGNWILCVSTTKPSKRLFARNNLDLYLVRADGVGSPTQLTFYKGNDYVPMWSTDGKSIYFISQRGSRSGKSYNIWRMNTPSNLNVTAPTNNNNYNQGNEKKEDNTNTPSKLPRKVK